MTGRLVEPDSAEDLTTAMVDAVNHPESRRERVREAAIGATERYGWSQIGDELAERLAETGHLARVES